MRMKTYYKYGNISRYVRIYYITSNYIKEFVFVFLIHKSKLKWELLILYYIVN